MITRTPDLDRALTERGELAARKRLQAIHRRAPYREAFEAAARFLSVEPVAVRVRSEVEIDAAITSLGREQECMIIVGRIHDCKPRNGDCFSRSQ